jgi:NAD(P)-dependent dehydrogenase (short-subunit alcohol dehydrogenase family)
MTTERFSLEGKIAKTLGGTSGIGRQISLGFAEVGATVIPVSRTPAKVEKVTAELQAIGSEARGHVTELRDLGALRELVDQVIADHGHIDILLNSQGITRAGPLEDFTEEDYDVVLDTNLKSVFFSSTEVGRHMLERGSGSIVNIASMTSYRGFPRAGLYGMSKFGIVSLTETMACEWADRGVRVNGIAPGFFLTDLNRKVMSAERKQLVINRTPMNRFGELEELVGAAIYLCSDAAKFVTGETIRVDGGFLAKGL